jgi:hypothetical protein
MVVSPANADGGDVRLINAYTNGFFAQPCS